MHLPKINDFDTYGLYIEKYGELVPFSNRSQVMNNFLTALWNRMSEFETAQTGGRYPRVSA